MVELTAEIGNLIVTVSDLSAHAPIKIPCRGRIQGTA
jgi:hypothetical protein